MAAAVGGLGGCSLLVPLDASSASEDPSAVIDAGIEASREDAAPPPVADAAPPRTDGGAAVAAVPCLPQSILCEDFESPPPFTPKWSSVYGGAAPSTVRAVSPAHSLLTSLRADDSVSGITKELLDAPLRLRMRFHVFMPTAPSGFVEILKTPWGDARKWDSFTIGMTSSGLSVAGQRYDDSDTPALIVTQQLLDASAFGVWHLVDVVWDMTKSPKTMTVTIDTMAPYTLTLPSTRVITTGVNVLLGPGYHDPGQKAFDAYFDDVSIAPMP
jgi:hypothetical protein